MIGIRRSGKHGAKGWLRTGTRTRAKRKPRRPVAGLAMIWRKKPVCPTWSDRVTAMAGAAGKAALACGQRTGKLGKDPRVRTVAGSAAFLAARRVLDGVVPFGSDLVELAGRAWDARHTGA